MNKDRSSFDFVTTKLLSPWQTWLFFIVSMLIYCLPLILNQYPYHDDNYRSLFALTSWYAEGRVAGDYLMHALTFTPVAPNVFPLTLLGGLLAISWSLHRLAHHWFATPSLLQCAVLLPIWFNPFYLQMLTYQYDSFMVSVGIALVILAMTYRHRVGLFHWAVPVILLTIGLSAYQVILSIFVGLVCVDVLQEAHKHPGSRHPWRLALHHTKVLFGAGGLYCFTSYQAIRSDRGGVFFPSPEEWAERMSFVISKVLLFVTPGNAAIFIGLAGAAAGGWILIAMAVRPASPSVSVRLAHLFLCAACIVVMVFAVGGLFFFLRDIELSFTARVLMSLSPLLVALLFLAYLFLVRIKCELAVLICLPLLCFLSFSYAYGQVVHDKKERDVFARTLLASDLLNHPRIATARDIVFMWVDTPVFTPVCVQAALPAMKYILHNEYFVLPEQLVKWGFTMPMSYTKQNIDFATPPLLARPFYEVYTQGEHVYVKFLNRPTKITCDFS